MAAHHDQVGEVEEYLVEVGDGAPRLGRAEGPGVAHLGGEGDAQLNTRRVEGIVAPVVRR